MLREHQEKLAANIVEMRALADKTDGLSGEEEKRYQALETESNELTAKIERAKKIDEMERMSERAEPIGGREAQRELRNYSIAKATVESMNGQLTGQEKEWHDELSKGREVRGVMVPTDILLGGEMETRVLKTTTPGAGPGSNLIATDLAAMSDRRRPPLMIERMGATLMRGLTGNMDLPRLLDSGTAHWVAEHTDTTRSDMKFAKKSMRPKTVSGEYEVSRRMLLQSATALEPLMRRDLSWLLAQAVDKAAIRGGGTNEPVGILEDSSVAAIAGGAWNSDIAADLIEALELDDVTGTRAFVTNTKVMAQARKVKDNDGHILPISEQFHGERVESSTQVPSDIGTGNDKNALIYGEWASLYLGYWSGVDLLMNPYHADVASKGGALLHAFLDCDVLVRHGEAFRYAEVD